MLVPMRPVFLPCGWPAPNLGRFVNVEGLARRQAVA